MHKTAAIENQNYSASEPGINPVQRITALWALSEAALGGALHAFRIPFTGLFVGGSAVIFITLINFFNDQSGSVIKATLIVMAVKGLVSPHTPVNAYLAVAFQGIIGEALFFLVRSKKIAAFLLGFLSLFESALQKLLVITIVFGQNIWDAIDLFTKFILNQFALSSEISQMFSMSLILVSLYMVIHLSAGIIIGLWAPRLADTVKRKVENMPAGKLVQYISIPGQAKKTGKKKRIRKKISIFSVITLATVIFILSYFFPFFEKRTGYAALLMIFRSVMIIGIWYYFAAPFLLKQVRRFLDKKSSRYKREIDNIIHIFPAMKQVIYHSWKSTADAGKLQRIPRFVEMIIVNVLTMEI